MNTMIYIFKVIHYYWPMYLATFILYVLKYMHLILLIIFCTRVSVKSSLKKVSLKSRSIKLYWDVRKRYQMQNISSYLSIWEIIQKIAWIVLNKVFLFSNILQKHFCEYIKMENSNPKDENIEIKYLNNMWKNQFL